MAKYVALCVLVAALVVLAFQADIAAAQCPAFNLQKVAVCSNDVRASTCGQSCKMALDTYASQSDSCICSFVNSATGIVSKDSIKGLLQRCYPGRSLSCLN